MTETSAETDPQSEARRLIDLAGDRGIANDLDDCLRLLVTFELGDSDDPDVIDLRVIRGLVGDDWGWFKTISLNLERIGAAVADGSAAVPDGGHLDLSAAVQALSRAVVQTPKSRRWKLRDRIGERKRWYELPEETPHH